MGSSNTTVIKELSDKGTDGTRLGQTSSDLVGFFGATPVIRQTLTTAPSNTVSVSVSATQWAYSTSTQCDAIVACVRAMNSTLITLGLWA